MKIKATLLNEGKNEGIFLVHELWSSLTARLETFRSKLWTLKRPSHTLIKYL